jgi:uncharacterized repeat protein (TIGR03803 family)
MMTGSSVTRPARDVLFACKSVAAVIAAASLSLSGCGSGDGTSSSATGQTFSLRATLSGLQSSGLVLTVNGTAVSVAQGQTASLASSLPSGTSYSVAVATQPTGETCTVAGGTGTIQSANAANVVVTCSDKAYSLGGSISGLDGSGLVLASGGSTLSVSSAATSFTMPTPVAYTSSYALTVQSQPAGLACSVHNGTGTMPAGAVTNIAVTCTDQPFSLGGTISGLGNHTGLVLTNGDEALTVAAGSTSFTMPTAVSFGTAYSVIVQSSPAGLTCSASNASGTMPASNFTGVVIACSDQSYTVGGTISGLTGGGLVLANGGDRLSVIPGASSFTMPTPVAYTSSYSVTVQTQPTGLTCSVSNGTNTMGTTAVTNIAITCSANTYTVGGTITGLTTSGLVLLNNGGDATTINSNTAQFAMNTGVAFGGTYAITVQTQPMNLVCSVSNGTGSVGAAEVGSVSIACVTNTTVLYSFAGSSSSDGEQPEASLIQDSNGNFYGTTEAGGANGAGTVFKITPSGTESVLHSFTAGSDGAGPQASLIQGSDGTFYGTTDLGGPHEDGTVFSMTSAGTETALYSFAGGSSDGQNPQASLIQGSDGNFYGTTAFGGANGHSGGANGDGTVFKITPSGTETVLYSFAGGSSDGSLPAASLIQGSDGNFYGTTEAGGAHGDGTVFKITPSGTETVLYSFAGGSSDGSLPAAGLIQGSDGNFYGTTEAGGAGTVGTVFKITPSGTETVLYSFAGGSSDGSSPGAGLIQGSDGNFYGTTLLGGANEAGTVFKVTPSGTETILHSFAGDSGGSVPAAGLIQGSDGNLYGTTLVGGASGLGTVFKVALQ